VLITVLGAPLHGWPAVLVGQPAAWTVPLAFVVMVVSLLTARRVPGDDVAPARTGQRAVIELLMLFTEPRPPAVPYSPVLQGGSRRS